MVDGLGDDLLVVERDVGDGVVGFVEWADCVIALPEQPGAALVGDHHGMCHRQDPAAEVAGGVVEDAQLVGITPSMPRLSCRARVKAWARRSRRAEGAGQRPLGGGAAVDDFPEGWVRAKSARVKIRGRASAA